MCCPKNCFLGCESYTHFIQKWVRIQIHDSTALYHNASDPSVGKPQFLILGMLPYNQHMLLPEKINSSLRDLSIFFAPYHLFLLNSHFFLHAQPLICCCSVARSCPTLCNPMDWSTPGFPAFTIPQSLLKLMSIESAMPFDHLILCHLPSPAFNHSHHQGLFQWVSSLHQAAKVLGFQFQHQSFQWIFRIISFRTDWFDLAIQGTLKSLPQDHSSKASILQYSVFFTVQLSHPYMTAGKTIALNRWTFIGKVMSLLLNILSMFVVAFLPKSKCLLISWL